MADLETWAVALACAPDHDRLCAVPYGGVAEYALAPAAARPAAAHDVHECRGDRAESSRPCAATCQVRSRDRRCSLRPKCADPLTGEVWRGPDGAAALSRSRRGTESRQLSHRGPAASSARAGQPRTIRRAELPSAPRTRGRFEREPPSMPRGRPMECDRHAGATPRNDCRAWITRTLSIDLANRPNERAIILAMALGTIEPEAKELEKPFQQSGTLHIFAVSGLHVAIVGLVFWALAPAFWPPPRRAGQRSGHRGLSATRS